MVWYDKFPSKTSIYFPHVLLPRLMTGSGISFYFQLMSIYLRVAKWLRGSQVLAGNLKGVLLDSHGAFKISRRPLQIHPFAALWMYPYHLYIYIYIHLIYTYNIYIYLIYTYNIYIYIQVILSNFFYLGHIRIHTIVQLVKIVVIPYGPSCLET